ncbi:DUF3073 domain-containing protein [Jatrophihabitans telluris]|uniref:DUF3073 domain-containing protein n=1 Tax=Jatrophihabitans telluris TaxID=2038343 RepID=A0ABY4QYV1_9ACTN|nr:DUF3073 domain-containing protein [Jatrophihabitans telluris]UQX88287.1 DUF3073 domain-containing protein [Jatrophihabitans telluris]
MGRGRAKAKQTKVARELKYHTQDTDFSALQRELGQPPPTGYRREESDHDPYSDPYRESDADTGFDDDTWARRSG